MTPDELLPLANAYFSKGVNADAWGAMTDTQKSRALFSAANYLANYTKNKNYLPAVFEQALWLTTSEGTNAISGYNSVSVSTSGVSVSYGRTKASNSGGAPMWLSPVAWALLQQDLSGAGGSYSIGRLI